MTLYAPAGLYCAAAMAPVPVPVAVKMPGAVAVDVNGKAFDDCPKYLTSTERLPLFAW